MKKIIMAIALIVAVSSVSSVYAQQQDPAARAAAMKQKMKDDLKLTDVQADSVSAIQQEFRPQMRDVYQDQSMSQDDKKAKLQGINDQMNKRIHAVLGDDLFKKYQDWWQKNRPQRPPGGGGGGNQ
jgi:predicted transglutaminase-like cysteine proteinase